MPTQDETLVTRDGPVVTLTFNRPEARNAMTWGMYDRLYEVCEEVDADDSVRVLVLRGRRRQGLRGRHRHQPVHRSSSGPRTASPTSATATGASRASRRCASR